LSPKNTVFHTIIPHTRLFVITTLCYAFGSQIETFFTAVFMYSNSQFVAIFNRTNSIWRHLDPTAYYAVSFAYPTTMTSCHRFADLSSTI